MPPESLALVMLVQSAKALVPILYTFVGISTLVSAVFWNEFIPIVETCFPKLTDPMPLFAKEYSSISVTVSGRLKLVSLLHS